MTSDPRTVLIVRHGEKPGDPGHEASGDGVDLSARGKQRAAGLAYALPEAFGTPEVVIAAASTAHSHRPVQTVTPLADAQHLQIHDKYADTDYAALAHHLRTHDKYAGKLIVVCWHHGRIPALAEALAPTHRSSSGRKRCSTGSGESTFPTTTPARPGNSPSRICRSDCCSATPRSSRDVELMEACVPLLSQRAGGGERDE